MYKIDNLQNSLENLRKSLSLLGCKMPVTPYAASPENTAVLIFNTWVIFKFHWSNNFIDVNDYENKTIFTYNIALHTQVFTQLWCHKNILMCL